MRRSQTNQSVRCWPLRSVSQRDETLEMWTVRSTCSSWRCQSLHVVPGRRARCAESGRFSCYVVNTAVIWEERCCGGTSLPSVLGTSRPVVVLSSMSCVDRQWSCCVWRWFSSHFRRRRRRLCLELQNTFTPQLVCSWFCCMLTLFVHSGVLDKIVSSLSWWLRVLD